MVGNNLEVDIIGTSDKFTLTNWYLGNQYQWSSSRPVMARCYWTAKCRPWCKPWRRSRLRLRGRRR